MAIKVCFEFQKFFIAPSKCTSLTYEFKATQLPTPRPRDENRIRTDISMVWIFLWIWLTHLTQILSPESSWDTNHYILLSAVSGRKKNHWKLAGMSNTFSWVLKLIILRKCIDQLKRTVLWNALKFYGKKLCLKNPLLLPSE